MLKKKIGELSVRQKVKKSGVLYLLFLPVLLYYLIFRYAPMFGLTIAFKNYNIFKGFWESPWVGFKYFKQFLESIYFWRLIRNTLMINIYDMFWDSLLLSF